VKKKLISFSAAKVSPPKQPKMPSSGHTTCCVQCGESFTPEDHEQMCPECQAFPKCQAKEEEEEGENHELKCGCCVCLPCKEAAREHCECPSGGESDDEEEEKDGDGFVICSKCDKGGGKCDGDCEKD